MEPLPDYNRAKSEALRTLRSARIVRPPILPRNLAENYGLSVRFVRFKPGLEEVCGFIEFDNDRITVNADHSANRQTFTIAHELGHYILHRELYAADPQAYKVLRRHPIKAEKDPRETEANTFAANLLVPKDMLDLYGKYADDSELADLFAVSKEVIGFRKS